MAVDNPQPPTSNIFGPHIFVVLFLLLIEGEKMKCEVILPINEMGVEIAKDF